MPAISSSELNDVPHLLKSFYQWMMEGPSKKSAKNYTDQVKRLIVSHRKKVSSMSGDKYFEFVKTSCENYKGNSQVSAGLKKLIFFLAERANGAEGPWEQRAAHFELLFNITKGFSTW